MNIQARPPQADPYGIDIHPLAGEVSILRDGVVLAQSTRAKVMYETRLAPAVYVPIEDVQVPLSAVTAYQTFCPFKGTAAYRDVILQDQTLPNGVWSYDRTLPESREVQGFVAFMPDSYTHMDLGQNTLREVVQPPVSGPLIDWVLREASTLKTPDELTLALADRLQEHGIAISRLSVLIWSLHPQIAARNMIWKKGEPGLTTYAPSYEIHDHPGYVNSPLRHVSNGLGGVRQRLDVANFKASFPIMQDLRDQGATDYVAMPLPFSDGRINVLTLTSDAPDGFSTADLGTIFECVFVISRFYEVFSQRETAQTLLETYVGKRTGARVLGGEIRRGDGDEIDAAIMFCDLRNSSLLEEQLGRRDYIALLNRFFDSVSEVIQSQGGEVLKFIGDAVLAVFPEGHDATTASTHALEASKQIVAALEQINADSPHRVDCAIGLDFGRVTYGNVGSKERLDFTVIGQAANIAARLSDHGKINNDRIVMTAAIAQCCNGLRPMGAVSLHNVSTPVICYAAG